MFGFSTTTWVFFSIAVSCAIFSSFLVYQEIGELNRKLPDDKQISYFGMYPGKMAMIKREYKRLYPVGRVDFWRVAFQIAAFVFLALVAITAGFFR